MEPNKETKRSDSTHGDAKSPYHTVSIDRFYVTNNPQYHWTQLALFFT